MQHGSLESSGTIYPSNAADAHGHMGGRRWRRWCSTLVLARAGAPDVGREACMQFTTLPVSQNHVSTCVKKGKHVNLA